MSSGKPFDAMSDVGLRRLEVLMRGWKEHWGEAGAMPFFPLFPSPLTLQHHTPNITTFIYQPTKHHCNGMNTVHGGCISTIFDACTSVALMGRYSGEKWGGGGSSVRWWGSREEECGFEGNHETPQRRGPRHL
ncbi:hypothetical protein DID88_002173 [Monilinia fructigena]|uniref:Thioesterase domain-containing protein n=1 Tax=Monilinia fructigena TaxID=38457 RepID=A0A395IVV6_9HELO|nr:hypothetical protein DID88_002173 [Monilinia fructigena]